MPEDCHALIHKRMPPEVRHRIADFVNGSPDTFSLIPQEANRVKAIEEMWPAVQRWELSTWVNHFRCQAEQRITIFLKTDRASLRFLNSIGANVSLDSRDIDGDWEEELPPAMEQDHFSSKRVVPCSQSIINGVFSSKYRNLRCMFCYDETTISTREVNRLFMLEYGYNLWDDEEFE